MTFKIRKERGFEQVTKTPLWKNPILYETTGGALITAGWVVGATGGLILYNPSLVTVGIGGMLTGEVAVMGGAGNVIRKGWGDKVEYAYKFYPNKYDKKGAVVIATNKVEAEGKYVSHLLLNKGYTPRQIKNMDKANIKVALGKK